MHLTDTGTSCTLTLLSNPQEIYKIFQRAVQLGQLFFSQILQSGYIEDSAQRAPPPPPVRRRPLRRRFGEVRIANFVENIAQVVVLGEK